MMVNLWLILAIIYLSLLTLGGFGAGILYKSWKYPAAVFFCSIIPFILGLLV